MTTSYSPDETDEPTPTDPFNTTLDAVVVPITGWGNPHFHVPADLFYDDAPSDEPLCIRTGSNGEGEFRGGEFGRKPATCYPGPDWHDNCAACQANLADELADGAAPPWTDGRD